MKYLKLSGEIYQFGKYHRPNKIGIELCALYMILIIFSTFTGCEKNISVPQHLIGEWKTSSPEYVDRYLKITEHALIFGIGDGEEISQNIEGVNVKEENGEAIYAIHYKDKEEEKWSLVLIYSPSSGAIKLKNGNDIWEKVKTDSST